MEEILKKYFNRPLDEFTLEQLKSELEKEGYDIQSISVSSDTNLLSLEEDCITRYSRKNGTWEEEYK